MYGGERETDVKPVTVGTLRRMKQEREPIACLTAYDAAFASREDEAGVDLVLVGDTLGMVVQGHETTVPVTVDDVVYHLRAVRRGLRRAMLVADMPFASFSSPERALDNAVRMMQEGGASMVKLEGGAGQVPVVEILAQNGIPVCAHIGLKPQAVNKLGGFKIQGREEAEAATILDEAKALEAAGADIVLLECVPSDLGRRVTEALSVPVIGIGAGPDVDGQILVVYDMLDITPGRKPRFAKNFMAGAGDVAGAIAAYVKAVKERTYPAAEHCF